MKILSYTSSKEAARLLGEWSRLTTTIYNTAKFEVEPSGSRIWCAVLLPNNKPLRVHGGSIEDAAIQLTTALQAQLTNARCQKSWTPEWEALLNTTKASKKVKEAAMEFKDADAISVARTKERQETIGVTSKKSLYESLSQVASVEGAQVSAIARSLVYEGFEDLENRMFAENPRRLLEEYEHKLDAIEGLETTQWMLRVSRHESLRIKFMAKEYGKSVSRLAAMCLNEALHVKYAYVFEVSAADIEAACAAINRVKGTAVRTIAEKIGLKREDSPLLSGVLSGRIEAPGRLLEKLSATLSISTRALKRATSDVFQSSLVPAYKSEDNKPTVMTKPESWDAAVRSLNRSVEDTNRLLHIGGA